MLSQVVLQFFFQLAFDHALSGHIRVSYVTLLFDYTRPVVQVHVLQCSDSYCKGHALMGLYELSVFSCHKFSHGRGVCPKTA